MNTIVKAIGGSRLYGINRENSDMDIRGIFIEPLQTVLFNGAETIEEKPDTVYHSLRKFARLLIANNPSALELLFTPDTYILQNGAEWKYLQQIRACVLSRRVIKSYGGFLTSQLKNFERDSSDKKAVVHAYRLALQLQGIVVNGTLDPTLPNYIRTQILSIYSGASVDPFIAVSRILLKEAEEHQSNLPEQPDETRIKDLVTETYYAEYVP